MLPVRLYRLRRTNMLAAHDRVNICDTRCIGAACREPGYRRRLGAQVLRDQNLAKGLELATSVVDILARSRRDRFFGATQANQDADADGLRRSLTPAFLLRLRKDFLVIID